MFLILGGHVVFIILQNIWNFRGCERGGWVLLPHNLKHQPERWPPGQYTEYPVAAQGLAQQALLGGGSGIETSYGKSTLNSLKNTENFTDSAIEHIFEGQVNARGKAVGYHYKGIEGTSGNVIPETESSTNNFGIYKAKVEVNGIPKTANGGFSSFYPKSMSRQEVIGRINEPSRNRVYIRGNTYSGLTSSGMEIEMFLDKNGKIISAYPVY